MAAREQRDEHLLDDLVLADDDLAQLGEDLLPAFGDFFCSSDNVHLVCLNWISW